MLPIAVQDAVCAKLRSLDTLREQDILGQMWWSQQFRATDYFSRWIALKESMQDVQGKKPTGPS